GFAAQVVHLAGGRSSGGIAGQTTLARFHELLRPGVIQALGDAFLAAQLGDTVFAAQPLQHDPDFVFCREVPARRTPYVLHHPLGRGLRRRFFQGGFGLHLRSFVTTTKPKSSLNHNLKSVPWALTGDNRRGDGGGRRATGPADLSRQPAGGAIDQVSLSLPLSFDPAAVNLSFTSLETVAGDRGQIASLSLTRPLGRRASLFATAYKDFSDRDSAGLYAGLSLSFDGGYHAATGVSSGAHGTSVTADLMKSGGDRIGSYGWRLRDSEGEQVNRHASAQYRASFGRMQAGIGQVRDSVQAHAQLGGAVIFADGDVFLANRVHDAFAVVDAGAPGVE